jgi:HEAT repeat protein
MSPVPSIETEQVLIDCLDHLQFRSVAASHLGRMGSHRAAGPLRRLLEEGLRGWETFEVTRAISRLADPAAVVVLAQMAGDPREGDLESVATALGAIGTVEAERELVRLLDGGMEADWLVSGLFFHGSSLAVARVVMEARKEGRGPNWLAVRMRRAFRLWGWTAGRFYTHIQDAELIAYLDENEQALTGQAKWDLLHAVEGIDSENVRRLVRRIAGRHGTPEDVSIASNGLMASTQAYVDLMHRGDTAAVEHFVAEAIRLDDKRPAWAPRKLVLFPREEVARCLRQALTVADTIERRTAIVRLLGHFGREEDAEAVRGFVQSEDNELADAAYEAVCRLSDPLLVPADWGGL